MSKNSNDDNKIVCYNKGSQEVTRMKKFIPAIVAIALIIVVLLCSFGVKIAQRYSYSKEQQDLNEYYSVDNDEDVAIVLQNEIIDIKAKLLEGSYYMDFSSVQSLLNDRFYVDTNENLLIYTTPTDIIKSEIGRKKAW